MSIDHRGGSTLHGHLGAKHVWTSPPPGAGSLRVCRHCGQRETIDQQDRECLKTQLRGDLPAVSEYDPFNA